MLTSHEVPQIPGRFGLLLLDEVHTSAAKGFRDVYPTIDARCRVGLTATLVREDGRVADLSYLTGPVLFQESWQRLVQAGVLAPVRCFEVRCPMTPVFYDAYLRAPHRHRLVMTALNPRKLAVLQFLVRFHAARRHKTIVFCDSIVALDEIARRVGCPVYSGEVPAHEREAVLARFRDGTAACVAMSSIGDTSLDIPDATVVVQASTHHGSRRQQVQRLGRIARVAAGKDAGYFYSLTSTDTAEERFARRRQRFLENVGFGFEAVALDATPMPDAEQRAMLRAALARSDRRFSARGRAAQPGGSLC